jgi:ubiquitin carboxyl-terminal hydrolase 5/13
MQVSVILWLLGRFAEASIDIYCYVCNEERLDPELSTHLAAFGINVATQTKTEKSMTELVSG